MTRKIAAFLFGLLVINAITLYGHTILSGEISKNIAANFCGACCTGYICKKRGFLYGASLTIGNLLIVILILFLLTYQNSEGQILLPGTPGLPIKVFSAVIPGLLGGSLGEYFSKKDQLGKA